MPIIQTLPQHLVAKIAAGEVVERAASVVKELVENSIDAGASFITVEIEKAGLKMIRVTDNGHGMDKVDILECFKPHTTSKITEEDDLTSILSFGFRGEALSSMAAVSDLQIKSKLTDQSLGTSIKIVGRVAQDIRSCGMADGTQISVENLFRKTPARKKFLKTSGSEFSHIVNLLSNIALSFPSVGFSLSHNGKLIIELPPKQTLEERLRILFGNKISDYLVPLSTESRTAKISGFIGKPQIASKIKNKQFIFVNQRLIKNSALSWAIKEAYGSLLEARIHPVFVLFLELPPETIDVNVHPRKEEIKFLDCANLIRTVSDLVRQTLDAHNLTYQLGLNEVPLYDSYDLSDKGLVLRDGNLEKDLYTSQILKKSTDLWQVKELAQEDQILQIHNLYLVTKTTQGILIIDQHAAHERILYEQLLATYHAVNHETYQLPRSIVFDLPVSEAPLLVERLPDFNRLGFDIEPFGHQSFKVNAIPDIFRKRDIGSLISEVLYDLIKEKSSSTPDIKTDRIISFLACRSAIKSGDYLTDDERKKLLDKLRETKSNYTCPHGRPVQIEISLSALDGLFKRK